MENAGLKVGDYPDGSIALFYEVWFLDRKQKWKFLSSAKETQWLLK